jgi:hypothetical protein
MRSIACVFVGIGFVIVLAACNGRPITDACPSGGRTGAAPNCVLTAQCKATNVGVTLDCSAGDGNCVCAENGVVGQTVPYQDDFCTAGDAGDFDSLEPALESANSACGWKLQ